MGRPQKIRSEKLIRVILRLLDNQWGLSQIASRIKVSRRTLSRFIHANPNIEKHYMSAWQARVCQHLIEKDFKGKHQDHPLRAIFFWDRFNPQLALGRRPQRARYRDSLISDSIIYTSPRQQTFLPVEYLTPKMGA